MSELLQELNTIRKRMGLQLTELNIRKKESLGDGESHITFPLQTRPDQVVKVGWDFERGDDGEVLDWKASDVDPEHVRVFSMFPDLFPKVIRTTKSFMVMERLDTKRVDREDMLLMNAFEEVDENQYGVDAVDHIYYDVKDYEPRLEAAIAKLEPEMQKLALTYVEFFERVLKLLTPEVLGSGRTQPDIHYNNIGYTKDGKLKLLDF